MAAANTNKNTSEHPETDEKSFIEKNITNLKSHFKAYYPDQASIKVLENVGDFRYVVKFTHSNASDLNISLQIPSNNKLAKSNLIVNSSKNEKYNAEKLKQLSESLSSTLHSSENKFHRSENILLELFTKCLEFIDDNFVASARTTHSKGSVLKTTSSNKKSSGNNKNGKKSDSDEESNKKCSMKTAGDVVKRIQWDSEINEEYIVVGYLDRFVGIKECTFNTFDWGDIVLADLGALAIPEHRIHYFKYKNVLIWDKNTRLDNVFGSTGSQTNIYDIIKKLENEQYTPQIEVEEVHKLGKNRASNQSAASASVLHNENNKEADKPNYFVSIPINNSEIKNNFMRIMDDLIESSPEVEPFLVPNTSMHLTLCTLCLNDESEINLAKNVLESLTYDDELLKETLPISFEFKRVGTFYDKVMYAKCNVDKMEKLAKMRTDLLEKFENSGLNIAGNYYEFVPHLTIMKISRSSATISDLVDKEIIERYEEFRFGEQRLSEIELCKMGNIFALKTYPVEYTVKF